MKKVLIRNKNIISNILLFLMFFLLIYFYLVLINFGRGVNNLDFASRLYEKASQDLKAGESVDKIITSLEEEKVGNLESYLYHLTKKEQSVEHDIVDLLINLKKAKYSGNRGENFSIEHIGTKGTIIPTEDKVDEEKIKKEVLSVLKAGEKKHSQERLLGGMNEHGITNEGHEKMEAYYLVNGDKITLNGGEENTLYQDIWEMFIFMVPHNFRESIDHFIIVSDPDSKTIGYIGQNNIDNQKWDIVINISKFNEIQQDKERQIYLLLHEFAHLLTLNKDQVVYFPTSLESEQLKAWFLTHCESNFVQEGCLFQNSYINSFINEFWSVDDRIIVKKNFSVYSEEKFVNLYASKNAVEDIAESFIVFVLSEKSDADTISNEKINFFYKYDELVQLRKFIRERIATIIKTEG